MPRPLTPANSPRLHMTGAQLRKWRIMKAAYYPGEDWTQEGAAAWFGVAERTWRKWENGEKPISYPLIMRIVGEGDEPGELTLHGMLPPEELDKLRAKTPAVNQPLSVVDKRRTTILQEKAITPNKEDV